MHHHHFDTSAPSECETCWAADLLNKEQAILECDMGNVRVIVDAGDVRFVITPKQVDLEGVLDMLESARARLSEAGLNVADIDFTLDAPIYTCVAIPCRTPFGPNFQFYIRVAIPAGKLVKESIRQALLDALDDCPSSLEGSHTEHDDYDHRLCCTSVPVTDTSTAGVIYFETPLGELVYRKSSGSFSVNY